MMISDSFPSCIHIALPDRLSETFAQQRILSAEMQSRPQQDIDIPRSDTFDNFEARGH